MMLLYEEGKWQLDDLVTKFIPKFADLKVLKDDQLVPLDRPMTLRHVMASCAGFAFGPALGSTNPKVDELYAAATKIGWQSSPWRHSQALSTVTGSSRKSKVRSSGVSLAKKSTLS
jgi:CubicO group peptidase (beta-lactamase class C family)